MNQILLVNIQRLLVYIRSDITSEKNIVILDIINEVLNNKYTSNELINILENKVEKDDSIISQLMHETICHEEKLINEYEEKIFIDVMHYTITKINRFIQQNDYDIAYDIVDIIHVFPDIIIGCNKKVLKRYWKIYINPIQKKWKNELFEGVREYFR